MAEVICPGSCSAVQSPHLLCSSEHFKFCSFSTSMEIFGTERCLQVIFEYVTETTILLVSPILLVSLCFKDADRSLYPAWLHRATGCVL